ncbi:acyltransferase [Massilia sp. Dwa41.01b]|uniref:acyltransferase family protein n=1 Tax=Massilia sp. Dwa41.01b TaxID=2709302 RepID=UPI0015FFC4B6|nr:acyltransferase [Massilia sp. Dwa41.01b]QNA89077.1 acyltransferase [Massilia sp. Dwa41.01b]
MTPVPAALTPSTPPPSPPPSPPAPHAPRHVPALDGWRGLAIVCLLLGHFFPVPGINLGLVGVHLFFVLSGLLMTRILFLQKAPLPLFYRRRIARIFPSVYFYLPVVTAVYLACGRPVDLFELATAASFTNNYLTNGTPWTMPFGHIWSLSVEEHAYVLLSIVAIASRATLAGGIRAVGIATAAIVLVACVYATVFAGRWTGLWDNSEVAAFGIFASGLLLLLGARGRPGPSSRVLPAMLVPGLMLLGLAAHWWSLPRVVHLLAGCGAFALAVNALDRAPSFLRSVLEWPPLRQLGTWSFSLYLWQQPFYQLVRHEGLHPAPGLGLS